MKIFVDFEATQFSEEVISIGAIREDGETFYSLVAPVDGKITPFITNLTGITAEMVKTALHPNEVFNEFYKWVFNYTANPEFYCWGTSDINFLRHTFKRCFSLNAKIILGWMCGGLIDYSKQFCKLLKIKNCKLIKAYNCLHPDVEQNHNALDDAVKLKEVFDACAVSDAPTTFAAVKPFAAVDVFDETSKIKWSKMGYPIGTICMIKNKNSPASKIFSSRTEAAEYVITTWLPAPKEEKAAIIHKNTITNKIKQATNNSRKWYGYYWREVR